MLKLLVLPLTLFATIASAKAPEYKLPSAIQCTSKATSPDVQSFTIKKLNTKRPVASIPDQGLMEPLEETYLVQLGFSNECDNSYGLIFYGSDLQLLNEGKVKSVKGLLNYSSVDLDERLGIEGESTSETMQVDCTLLKK